MELVAGLFSLALVVSALCVFVFYITRSLRIQNELRQGGHGGDNFASDAVEVDAFASEHLFGGDILKIDEKVFMPSWTIIR